MTAPTTNPLTVVRHVLAWIEENVDLEQTPFLIGASDYPADPESNVHVQFIADSLAGLESLAARIPWSIDGDRWGKDFVPTLTDGMWRRAGTAFAAAVVITCGAARAVAS